MGGVHRRPAALSANKTAEQIKKRKHDRIHQLSCDLRVGGGVPGGPATGMVRRRNRTRGLTTGKRSSRPEYIGADHMSIRAFRLQLCGGPYIAIMGIIASHVMNTLPLEAGEHQRQTGRGQSETRAERVSSEVSAIE
jgi:hypothetical protein